jgi:hypothetical protein
MRDTKASMCSGLLLKTYVSSTNKQMYVRDFGFVDAVEEAWVELGLHVAFFLEAVGVVLVP